VTLFPTLLFLLLGAPPAVPDTSRDPARLREVLYDHQDTRGQSQAALLLVRDHSTAAEEIVRRGLKPTNAPDVFLALASALRMAHDRRFNAELLAALSVDLTGQQASVRRGAAEALAGLADPSVIHRLQQLLEESNAELSVRQTVLWVLGRSGRKGAAGILVEQLSSDHEAIQQAAADALADLTGLNFGTDRTRWRDWWNQNKDIPGERWLEQRLTYQASRARRLEGELERTRGQLVRLHQQLYSRLPAADRVGHIQATAEQEDPAVRQLAVTWSLELLTTVAGAGGEQTRPRHGATTRKALAEVLRRLSHDSSPKVQRQAVVALGRAPDEATFERLRELVRESRAPIRAAAVRALAQQARGSNAVAVARRKQAIPILQKALDDPALEVVVEAAEDLGALGEPEAAPVLACLLRHSSSSVRQAAVHALERVADASVLDDLLATPDDPVVAIRFSLVGALGRAACAANSNPGRVLTTAERKRLFTRLQELLCKDPNPGVRSRAATVLGECGPPSTLPALWGRVIAVEDARVQDKAWAAFVDVLARAASPDLLREWDARLARANPPAVRTRRLRLLNELQERWQRSVSDPSHRSAATRALLETTAELLSRAQNHPGPKRQ
jgi:HEAT repeat protein